MKMDEYRLLDIKEADYGCEERPEGTPLMCLLVLEKNDANNSEQSNIAVVSEKQESAEKLYAEIPDVLATELGLVNGVIISEEELSEMKAGRKPSNWDSISNRHYYQTKIGTVCMSNKEFMEYSAQSMN
jgi:hypothetical protein